MTPTPPAASRDDSPRVLLGMLDTGSAVHWSDSDLAGMLRHQLSLEPAAELAAANVAAIEVLAASRRWPSLRDALLADSPDARVLDALKLYGKSAAPSDDPAQRIRKVIYFAAIAAARSRLDLSITSLRAPELAAGIRWCIEQPWVDQQLRALFAAALEQAA